MPAFTHGQFYVAVSKVRSVNNIKVIWDEKLGDGVCKNVVYRKSYSFSRIFTTTSKNVPLSVCVMFHTLSGTD